MTESMLVTLKAMRRTLNQVEVCGEHNLNCLLASIQALEKLISEGELPQEVNHD